MDIKYAILTVLKNFDIHFFLTRNTYIESYFAVISMCLYSIVNRTGVIQTNQSEYLYPCVCAIQFTCIQLSEEKNRMLKHFEIIHIKLSNTLMKIGSINSKILHGSLRNF